MVNCNASVGRQVFRTRVDCELSVFVIALVHFGCAELYVGKKQTV